MLVSLLMSNLASFFIQTLERLTNCHSTVLKDSHFFYGPHVYKQKINHFHFQSIYISHTFLVILVIIILLWKSVVEIHWSNLFFTLKSSYILQYQEFIETRHWLFFIRIKNFVQSCTVMEWLWAHFLCDGNSNKFQLGIWLTLIMQYLWDNLQIQYFDTVFS